MSVVKKSIALFLLLIITAPSFGMTFFSHYCCEKRKSFSLFGIESCCNMIPVADEDTSSKPFEIRKKPCCEDVIQRCVAEETVQPLAGNIDLTIDASLLVPVQPFILHPTKLVVLPFLSKPPPAPPLLSIEKHALPFTGQFRI